MGNGWCAEIDDISTYFSYFRKNNYIDLSPETFKNGETCMWECFSRGRNWATYEIDLQNCLCMSNEIGEVCELWDDVDSIYAETWKVVLAEE